MSIIVCNVFLFFTFLKTTLFVKNSLILAAFDFICLNIFLDRTYKTLDTECGTQWKDW